MRAILDTNILIDLTAGHEAARSLLRSIRSPCISVVTRIELLSGPVETVKTIREILQDVQVIAIDNAIVEAAALIRRRDRLKLPDAVILATAQVTGLALLTRNTKDFEGLKGVVIPYTL